MKSSIRLTRSDKLFHLFIDSSLVAIFLILFIPIWSTITLSFRPNDYIGSALEGMLLPPWKWSTAAYRALLGHRAFLTASVNSFRIFFEGVATALFLTVPLAYLLSIKTLPGRKFFYILVIVPYLFNVGLVPNYLLVTRLGLVDKLAAIYLPGAISVYNTLIMKSFFEGISEELKESARIDGASELTVLMKIILPLSKPILLTIGLYYGVHFWNDFFNAMLYINDNKLQPLPILLRNILLSSGMNEYVEVNAFGEAPIAAIKAASVFLAAIPMLVAYPLIQKYFVKGTMLGSVKG
ncbi:MAG: carbohydrate ABC transporter permease [Spirochaetes bacterium]|nr:carbohydrate ABC transporter permease [Spirochaetota bacterium]